MKNIETILQELGIEVPTDKKKELSSLVNENYKTISEFNTQKEKLDTTKLQLSKAQEDFTALKEELGDLKPSEIKEKLNDYETKLSDQAKQFEEEMNKITLTNVLKDRASSLGCIDFDLAMSQFKIDDLLASKNQSADIETALNDLKANKPYLFKEEEKKPQAKQGIIGSTEQNNVDEQEALLRQAMGLE